MLWLDRFYCRSSLAEATSNLLENVHSQSSSRRSNSTTERCMASCFHLTKSCRLSVARRESYKIVRSIALVGRSSLAQIVVRTMARDHRSQFNGFRSRTKAQGLCSPCAKSRMRFKSVFFVDKASQSHSLRDQINGVEKIASVGLSEETSSDSC